MQKSRKNERSNELIKDGMKSNRIIEKEQVERFQRIKASETESKKTERRNKIIK